MKIEDIIKLFYCGADSEYKNRIKYFNIQDDNHCGRNFEVNIDYFDKNGNKQVFQAITNTIDEALLEFRKIFYSNVDKGEGNE